MELFDTLYERHSTTPSASQREKLEQELKKEIKRLQRFREQVKNWQAASEIKEKGKLLEYRRLVEQAMEKYKEVERGSKSKAYSDESLAEVQGHKEENEATRYVQKALDELQQQQEALEAERERLDGGRRSRRGSAGSDARRLSEIDDTLAHHLWHTQKLELVLRLLENSVLRPEEVMAISDDLDYYLDSNQDPDFIYDDTMYDDLNLDADQTIAREVHGTLEDEQPSVGGTAPQKSPSKVVNSDARVVKPERKVVAHRTVSAGTSASASAASVSVQPSAHALSSRPPHSAHSRVASHSESPSVATPTLGTPALANLRPAPVPKPASGMNWSAAVATAAASAVHSRTHSARSVRSHSSSPAPAQSSHSALNMNAMNAASVLEALKRQRPGQEATENVGGGSSVGGTSSTGSPAPAERAPAHVASTSASAASTPAPARASTGSPAQPTRTSSAGISASSAGASASTGSSDDPSSDPSFRFLPPGIQSAVLSAAAAASTRKHRPMDLMASVSTPRSFSALPADCYPPGLEAQRVATIWNQVRTSRNLEMDAQNVDTATLFYAYYFALSRSERETVCSVLQARQWQQTKEDECCWYQRHSGVKTRGEGFEVVDCNLFCARDWSLTEKQDYRVEC